jgi:hypothetical protein
VEKIRKRVSYAADIAGFCIAMDKYADINKVVLPKKNLVAKLNIELKEATDAMKKKQAEL